MKLIITFAIFSSLALANAAALVQPSSTFDEPWLELFAKQLGSAFQAKFLQTLTGGSKIGQGQDHRTRAHIEFEDPWLFPDTTHRVRVLFQDGEINTFHPTLYGLSNIQVNEFTVDIATKQVRYSVRFPMVTWQGEYNLWIDKYGFITPGPYERRRGEGHYSHTFKNVDYTSTFNLHVHADGSGRTTLQDVTSSMVFERCSVWSENYTINSNPISNWDAVSVNWKESFDNRWERDHALVEEFISFVFSSLFGWPNAVNLAQTVATFEYWGAEIVGTN